MKENNTQTSSKTILRRKKEPDFTEAPGPKFNNESKPESVSYHSDFRSIAEQLANSRFYYRNRLVFELKQEYPNESRAWHVDLFFPNATGGALYVDYVKHFDDAVAYKQLVDWHKERSNVMNRSGYRYVYLEHNTSLAEAKEQLGEK